MTVSCGLAHDHPWSRAGPIQPNILLFKMGGWLPHSRRPTARFSHLGPRRKTTQKAEEGSHDLTGGTAFRDVRNPTATRLACPRAIADGSAMLVGLGLTLLLATKVLSHRPRSSPPGGLLSPIPALGRRPG